jgi:hypothetical protein
MNQPNQMKNQQNQKKGEELNRLPQSTKPLKSSRFEGD